MAKETCIGCAFFRPYKPQIRSGPIEGSCCYNPPKIFILNHGAASEKAESYWPKVYQDDFCSKHERKPRGA